MIEIEFDDRPVLDALNELMRRASDPEPALRYIGEKLLDSTKQRFVDGRDPDGQPWAPNTPLTLAWYLSEHGSNFEEDGSLSPKGETRLGAKKPLTGKTRALQTTINYQVVGDTLMIGSPEPYAAMHQFGGTTSPRSMIPGQAIPARPFLGLSDEDRGDILEIVKGYLADAV
ncbi:MAG: phage virion morphogenesis protein [Pseudomonadota bacterium]